MRWRGAACVLGLLVTTSCYAQHEVGEAAGGRNAHGFAMPRLVGGEATEPSGAAAEPGVAVAPGAAAGAGVGAGSAVEPDPEPSEVCNRHQFVLSKHVQNARDLGGLPAASSGHVACGSLYRGPPLTGLSPDGCADVAALGIRTLIDLRLDSERNVRATSSCVNATQVLAPLPIPYGLAAADYLNDLSSPSIAVAFHTFADAQAYPIYFHCTWGRDRTGVVSALLLLALGATRQDVMQEYMLSKDSVGAYPDSLNAVLDEIERRGGAAALLSEAGISENELATLRGRAIAGE